MESLSTQSTTPSVAESPPAQSLDSPVSGGIGMGVTEMTTPLQNFEPETVTIALESINITFQSSSVRLGYFEVLSVECQKKAPVIEPGDILREFQGADMRVDSRRLRQLFTNEISASVILVFEKKKWAGTLLRLSFKVLTSKLRIETVPEWIDDAPHPRTVSQTARELLSHFQVPLQCGSAGAVEDITCFDDMEWKTAMLKFASILQNTPLNEARLSLCEALTVLFLHQNKYPSPVPSAFPEIHVDSAFKPEVITSRNKSSPMETQNSNSALRMVAATPKSMKPKTLLELAQGDFDLLDESTTSNSALENTHIEIDRIFDEHNPQMTTSESFIQMSLPKEMALPNESVQSNAAEEGQLGLMPIPLHFRLNSFSSPADTPRPQTSSKPSQPAVTIGSTSGSGGAHAAMSSPHLRSISSSEPAASPDILLPMYPKSSQFVDENVLLPSLSMQRLPHRHVETFITSHTSIPVDTEASRSPPLKSELSLATSPKSASATGAAEKAARMAHEMKALIGAQTRHAQTLAVQAAAASAKQAAAAQQTASAQQTAADEELKKSAKVLEVAYMHKVEETVVLRRECAKLQEIIGALKDSAGGFGGQSQDAFCDSTERIEARRVDTQSEDGVNEEAPKTRKQLLLSSLESFSAAPDRELAFEA